MLDSFLCCIKAAPLTDELLKSALATLSRRVFATLMRCAEPAPTVAPADHAALLYDFWVFDAARLLGAHRAPFTPACASCRRPPALRRRQRVRAREPRGYSAAAAAPACVLARSRAPPQLTRQLVGHVLSVQPAYAADVRSSLTVLWKVRRQRSATRAARGPTAAQALKEIIVRFENSAAPKQTRSELREVPVAVRAHTHSPARSQVAAMLLELTDRLWAAVVALPEVRCSPMHAPLGD
jgi:hypothetical protein